jgi:hypothetical protein
MHLKIVVGNENENDDEVRTKKLQRELLQVQLQPSYFYFLKYQALRVYM